MSDVLINFVGNTEQLKPAEDVLESIIAKEGDVGEAWKKTAAVFSAATKTSVESTNKLAKSIDALGVATKTMDKSVIGGAYKEYLKQIQAQLGLTNKELISYVKNARDSARQHILAVETDEEIDQLTLSIETMNEQLQILGDLEDQTGDKTGSLRSRIREAKEELVRMAEAGLAGTPAFVELQNHAGELDDQMKDLNATISALGSDTKNIDGIISVVSGLAGGFAVVQGAAALFGDESEDVQKALLKVNAAMSILQGLQQVQNVLQKESAASLFLTSIFYKQKTIAVAENTVATEVNVVATEAAVAAEAAQVVATEAATVATAELNAVMALNPIAIVVAAVVALAAALVYFTSNNKEAEKTQADLNDAIQQGTVYLDIYLNSLEHQRNIQVAYAKSAGKTASELAKLEGDIDNQRLAGIVKARDAASKAHNEAIANDKETAEKKAEAYQLFLDLDKKYHDERNALEVKAVEYRKQLADGELKAFITNQEAKVLATISGSDAERSAQIQEIKITQAARIKLAKDGAETVAEAQAAANKIIAEDDRHISELSLQNYQHALKGKTALSEAFLAKAQSDLIKNEVDSIESITRVTDAEIEALKRKKKEAASDPTLNPGERTRLTEELNNAILGKEKEKQLKILEYERTGLSARLLLSIAGSQEEYNNRIALIAKEEQIQLAAVEVSNKRRDEIRAEFDKKRQDASRAFYEAELQNQIAIDSASLERFGITEAEKLVLTLKRLEEQRDLEISQAQQNAAKIAEINAKYNSQSIAARKASINSVLADNLRTNDAFSAISIANNRKIIESDKLTYQQRTKAIQATLDAELRRLDLEHKALTDQVEQNLITNHEFDVAYQEILNKRSAATIASEKAVTEATIAEIEKRSSSIQTVFDVFQKGLAATMEVSGLSVALSELQNFGTQVQDVIAKINAGALTSAEGLKQLAVAAIAATQQIVNQIFADSSAARQQTLAEKLTALEQQKANEIDAENLTAQQKEDIEKKYQEKERQLKRQAFIADKEAKKEQAVINGLLAVTQAFATNPFPYSLIVAGIVAASTALQVSKISQAKVPKFFKGKVGIEGPGTTTSDSIPAMISKGESVINADSTSKWKDALNAINDNKFEKYLSDKISAFVFPHIPAGVQPQSTGSEIDYTKLAREIALHMQGIIPAPAQFHNTIDGDGLHQFVKRGNTKTEYKNKRYSMS